MPRRTLFLAIFALQCACSRDETISSTCDYLGGKVICVGVGGTGCTGSSASVDSNLETFGELQTSSGGSSYTATGGKRFPAGANAGAFITPQHIGTRATDITTADVTLNTLMMGAVVDSATGPALTITRTGPETAATEYVSLVSTAPFDGIQLVMNTQSSDILIYEFCGAATVR